MLITQKGGGFMANIDIRTYAKSKRVFMYEIAKALEISEMTLIRKLRQELSEPDKQYYIDLIDSIAAKR